MNAKNGFPVFTTQVEANWLTKGEDKYASFRFTDEERAEIIRLSKDPDIGESSPHKLVVFDVCYMLSICLQPLWFGMYMLHTSASSRFMLIASR